MVIEWKGVDRPAKRGGQAKGGGGVVFAVRRDRLEIAQAKILICGQRWSPP